MTHPLPASREEAATLQSQRKARALENARKSPVFAGRFDHVNLERLDDPEEWQKIPLLEKDELRQLSTEDFYQRFCIAPREDYSEYWRSGGTTGKPLFYPRTFADIEAALESFRRPFRIMGCSSKDVVHNSFPLGIHPIGQMLSRAAQAEGIGALWAGSGTNTPTEVQLQLIQDLKPTMWLGMSGYGLRIANLAEERGIDLASGSVERLIVSAEPLSKAKRAKLERTWGAEIYDVFGMTECSLMGCESAEHDGHVMFSDIAFVEVVDEETHEPVPDGEQGLLVTTPLFTNHCTPFLRWSSGDIVSMRWPEVTDDPYSIFPVVKHAHRTAGFFKVRGVNMNHEEIEDLMFAQADVTEFMCEAVTNDGMDDLKLSVEFTRSADREAAAVRLSEIVKQTFEVTPTIETPELGTLAREYDKMIKTNRFFDRRGD